MVRYRLGSVIVNLLLERVDKPYVVTLPNKYSYYLYTNSQP